MTIWNKLKNERFFLRKKIKLMFNMKKNDYKMFCDINP